MTEQEIRNAIDQVLNGLLSKFDERWMPDLGSHCYLPRKEAFNIECVTYALKNFSKLKPQSEAASSSSSHMSPALDTRCYEAMFHRLTLAGFSRLLMNIVATQKQEGATTAVSKLLIGLDRLKAQLTKRQQQELLDALIKDAKTIIMSKVTPPSVDASQNADNDVMTSA
jgi:hypothetical protein